MTKNMQRNGEPCSGTETSLQAPNNLSEDVESKIEQTLAKTIEPPDGGWGWIVVLGSFLIHVIVDGITYSFGVIFIALLEDFQGGKGDTAWILSIFVGMTLGSGPIASALVNMYSCRTVTMVGALIGAAGFAISSFAPGIWFLYLSLGIVAGFGFGLIYLPAIVIVSYYFEKRRALATGLACCGSGFGTFIFAPLSELLVKHFGWKETCFWMAAIILQCCIFGALFRPLPLVDNTEVLPAIEITGVELKDKALSESHVGIVQTGKARSAEVTKSKISLNHITSLSSLNQPLPGHQLKQHIPLHRKDVFYSGSLQNIPLYTQNKSDYVTSNMSIVHSLHQAQYPAQAGKKSQGRCGNFAGSFKSLIDFSLLKDWAFVLFLLSNFFTSLGFNAPFLFIPDRAKEYNISSGKAAFLVSIVGIANTVGRIMFGFIADLRRVKRYRLYIYNTGLVIAGLATAFSSGSSHASQIIYSIVFGVFIGCCVSLTAIILVDLLGVDKLTSSFGVTLLGQGVAVLIGPPICGWLYDATGSYMWPFAVTGGSIAFSGAMLYFIPTLSKFQHKIRTSEEMNMGVRIGTTSL
ncbi:monocarboxylate transporter 12-like [Watersipora subatra]|uniref:monocarboxylate transporter 12-like n=1 Tax=Watersipora subatra TaxID=2589382 RepID=UPI00355C0A2C